MEDAIIIKRDDSTVEIKLSKLIEAIECAIDDVDSRVSEVKGFLREKINDLLQFILQFFSSDIHTIDTVKIRFIWMFIVPLNTRSNYIWAYSHKVVLINFLRTFLIRRWQISTDDINSNYYKETVVCF